jgi:hypothetical protein
MNENIFFKFIGSKWFSLFLTIGMMLLLPITFKNMMIVYESGQMAQYLWIPAIFIINLITVLMAAYSFLSKSFKKDVRQEEW